MSEQPPASEGSTSAPRPTRRRRLSIQDYIEGVCGGDRTRLARAITLVESNRASHRREAQQVLSALLPDTGKALRVGITGVPGVGKSTFIESLGIYLLDQGHRVAVLAVDPTSSRRGGSILGDKTRMARLAADDRAFIRPSPSQGSLGGVHRKTRETMLLCEAAGFDVILVETVGVGQSETQVAEMVDTYLVLMLAGAGDELQGIKKGILEVADMLAINKADGDNLLAAKRARRDYKSALHLMTPHSPHWSPPVLTCSALQHEGIDAVWAQVLAHREALEAHGELEAKRRKQRLTWMWSLVEQELLHRLRNHPEVAQQLPVLESAILADTIPPTLAAEHILEAFGQALNHT